MQWTSAVGKGLLIAANVMREHLDIRKGKDCRIALTGSIAGWHSFLVYPAYALTLLEASAKQQEQGKSSCNNPDYMNTSKRD